jgi:hypothetical protein
VLRDVVDHDNRIERIDNVSIIQAVEVPFHEHGGDLDPRFFASRA